MDYKWSYCLNERQLKYLNRLAGVIPHFTEFLAQDNSEDLSDAIWKFRHSRYASHLDWVMSNNLSLMEDTYKQYCEEYKRSQTSAVHSSKSTSHLTIDWDPLPNWAKGMSVESLEYLNVFIIMVPGFVKYLQDRPSEENLYDLAEDYKKEVRLGTHFGFDIYSTLDVIKERFHHIMEHNEDAIHYVNHTKEVQDYGILENYVRDTKDEIFLEDTRSDTFRKYLSRYIREESPFISNRLFRILFRNDDMDLALYSANKAFKYAFSSPNHYWYNREGVYGCADTVYCIVDSLGFKGLDNLGKECPAALPKILVGLYHLLSRIIYWTDKEKYKNELYGDTLLPVNVQHKLRAYRLRSNLVEHYGSYLTEYLKPSDQGMSCLSDLMSAHTLANSFGIVGDDSLFKREAIRVFHQKELFRHGDIYKVSEMGFRLNDKLSKSFHGKYLNGNLAMETIERNRLFRFLQQYYSEERRISCLNSEPLSYLVKDNFSPAYKTEKEEIRKYLSEHGIKHFYHFTERGIISSIIRTGGLMSSKRCLDEGVAMPVREDMARSRDIDARYDLEDFARLSFSPCLPKLDERKKEGAELVMLLVSTEVALFEETQFTDMEATHEGFSHGKTLSDLKRVHIDATQRTSVDKTDPEYWFSQAEILVKSMVPLKYILNIKDPIKL